MRVALIGGTGKLGRGLAMRLSTANEVLLGSRDERKAVETAEKLRGLTGRNVNGGANEDVARACDVAVLTVPSLDRITFFEQLRAPLAGKIVISPIVPMRAENGLMVYAKAEGSAAEEVATVLNESRVVAALHNIPAMTMEAFGRELSFDVLVACDDRQDYEQVSKLIEGIDGLRPLYVGPLAMSRSVESLTPLLLNAAKLNGLKRLSVKFVS